MHLGFNVHCTNMYQLDHVTWASSASAAFFWFMSTSNNDPPMPQVSFLLKMLADGSAQVCTWSTLNLGLIGRNIFFWMNTGILWSLDLWLTNKIQRKTGKIHNLNCNLNVNQVYLQISRFFHPTHFFWGVWMCLTSFGPFWVMKAPRCCSSVDRQGMDLCLGDPDATAEPVVLRDGTTITATVPWEKPYKIHAVFMTCLDDLEMFRDVHVILWDFIVISVSVFQI